MAQARSVGAFRVLDQLAEAGWQPFHPTSWLIGETAALIDLRHVSPVPMDQCTCGTPYKKPTELLQAKLRQLADVVCEVPNHGQSFHRRYAQVLAGRDSSGKFLTSPAKECPSDFSKTIAVAICQYIQFYCG